MTDGNPKSKSILIHHNQSHHDVEEYQDSNLNGFSIRKQMSEDYEYDFGISFAGKNRDTANNLEKLLSAGGAEYFMTATSRRICLVGIFKRNGKKFVRQADTWS